MHRCLQIPEIVHLIIQVLSLSPKTITKHALYFPHKPDVKTLLSLSLASKSFLEPCLDALWGCMDSAKPLLDLMVPPDKRPSEKDTNSATSVSYPDAMNLAQIIDKAYKSRVHYYADRVRGLRVRYGDIVKPVDRALSVWLSAHDAPLLSNLGYLHWEENTLELYPCLRVFSGLKMTSFRLTVDPWPQQCEELVHSTFSSFQAACPLLTAIEVDDLDNGVFEDSGQQLCLILSAFLTITREGFWLAPSSDTLSFLAMMPNLHTVINRLCPSKELHRIEPAMPSLEFPALQVLRWSVAEFKDAMALLSRLRPGVRDLQGIAIRCDGGDFDASDIIKFFDAIHMTCSPQTLTSLSLEATDDPKEIISHGQRHRESADIPCLASSLVLLRSLRYFSHIKEFSVARLPMVLDNQLAEEISKAWPFLQHLELVARLIPGESKITLAGLQTIARRCHLLEYLAVEVSSMSDNELHPSRDLTHSDNGNKTRIVEVYYDGRDAESDCRRSAWTQSVQHLFPHAQVNFSQRLGHNPLCDLSEGIIMDLI